MKSKILVRLFLLSVLTISFSTAFGQVKAQFEREKLKEEAIKNGMPEHDLDGYLFAKEREFYDNQEWATKIPSDPYAWNAKGGSNPNILGAGCVNASFENNNFGNWTGSSGNSNTCGPATAQSPNYNIVTPAIVSPAGPNAGLTNAANYHTIMNIPATNPMYPNCNQFGYDSVGVLVVGSNTVSQIPHVAPFYPDGKSVRMNGALANYRACKLRYNFALTPNNRNITYAFALVLYGAHSANMQPYFKVSVLDQNNNPIGGSCGVYNVNGLQATTDTSFFTSAIGFGQVKCRKWRQYGVDLTSPIYATVTAVNLEFTVGGCCAGGHYGYAYVDAECAQGGTYVGMCSGTNSAVITAPGGYVAYQWYQLPGMIPQSPLVGGNTQTLTVNPAIVGQVFQVNMVTPTGCTIALIDTIQISSAQILSIPTVSTCPGGTSGAATVNPVGSNTGYTYTWTALPSNSVVANTYTVNNLPPGIYSVAVQGISCGPPASATVQIATAPPTFYTYTKNYCGSLAILTASAGTNYTWYQGTTLMVGQNTSSLVINNPVNNSVYYSTYVTPQGCKDSVRWTLVQIGGGSIYVSNIKELCPTSPAVGYAVINLNTTQTGPYSYTVTGPSSYNSTLLNTPLKKDSVIGLSLGTYTVLVYDGACFYNTTFSVTPYNYTYTVTPTNTVLCITGTVPMGVMLSNTVAPVCGGAVTAPCGNPKIFPVGNGTLVNSQWGGFPCVYGAYYDVCRHQLLYTAAELTAAGIQAGTIPSMQFVVNSILPVGNNTQFYIGTLQGFTIKMKCTNLTVLNNVWDNVGFTQVLNPVNYSPTQGWNNHTFNTPFNWDGVSSILVDVCFNFIQTNPFTSNPIMPYANVGAVRTRYYYSTSQALCGLPTTAFTTTNRPNVRFGNCPITKPSDFTYLWTPNYALTSTTTQSTTSTPSTSTIYSITVNPIGQTNCAQTQTVDINVVIPVTPTITSGVFCTNFAPTPINVTPTTGTWTPTAYMSGAGIFSPGLAAVGGNTVAYTTGTGTCSAASTLTINVEQFNPATLTGTVVPLCITDPQVNLMGIVANTTGTWSGVGITNNVLDPNAVTPGLYVLSYNTNSIPTVTLCPDVSTLQIGVFSVQQPTITQVGPYCNNSVPIQLIVAPPGGFFNGLNNNATSPSGLFDPTQANIGVNTIGYTITSGPCVKTTSIDINVEQFIPASLTGTLGPYCWNAPPANLSTITLAGSGVWSGAGVSGGIFNPLTSGPGNFVLSYNTNSMPTTSLCPDVSQITVHVNPQPLVSITTNTLEGCRALTINFDVPTVSNGTGYWNFGDGSTLSNLNAVHTYTAAGTYNVTYTYADDIGCQVITQVPPIVVHDLPVADFYVLPGYELSIADPQAQFINTSTILNNNTYIWNFADYAHSDQVNVNYTFTNYGTMLIYLFATNEFGCKDTAIKIIQVKNDNAVWVPNAFTPNGDGFNDLFGPVFSPYGISADEYEFDIFDRWGEKIFSTTDIYVRWNGGKFNKGELVKEDVYVWKLRYKTTEKEVKYKTGHVTLMK